MRFLYFPERGGGFAPGDRILLGYGEGVSRLGAADFGDGL